MNVKDFFEKITGCKSIGEYKCGNNSLMYLFECKKSPFGEKLSELLSAEGAVFAAEYEVGALYSASYFYENKHLFVSYSENEGLLRVTIDKNTDLPSFERKNQPNLCPIRLWQFEVDHSLIDCGMCYLIQLSDYSFFVIDSAHVYSVNDDIRLYEFMRVRTPEDRRVRVAGWFFSHGHSDHIVKFLDILSFNKDIKIDGLYYNFAPVDHFSSVNWDESEIRHAEEFLQKTSERRDIPKYTLHSGQRFFVGDIEILVLCTHEDVFPNSLDNYNDSSSVILVRVGDDTVLFTGDAGGEESRILEIRFSELLKCDILQIAHHGHFGLSPEFYRRAKADVVLFPTTKIKYDEEFPVYEANRVAVSLAKHCFIASDGTVEFTFPLKNSAIKIYPDETIENFDGIKNLWSYEYPDSFKENLKSRFSYRRKSHTVLY